MKTISVMAIAFLIFGILPLGVAGNISIDREFSTGLNIDRGAEIGSIQEINDSFGVGTETIQEIGTWQYGGLIEKPPIKVYNNVWGASDAEKASGTLKSYIYYRSDGHFGWDWNRPSPIPVDGHILPLYPEVAVGTSNPTYFPIRLGNINSLTAQLEYGYTRYPTGAYNLAYDIMVRGSTGIKAEVMIWVTGNGRPGIYGGEINDGYNTYDLYYTNPSSTRPWAYYAFILKNQGSTVHTVNIKALFQNLISSGRLNADWLIGHIDLGNEIWKGSGRIEISKWIIKMNGIDITSSSSSSISVTSPNSGENWARGTTKTISWTYSGNTGAYVKIELLKGGILNRVITSSTPNDGSLSWTIPSTQTLGSDYKIKVTSATDAVHTDTSNNNFIINSPVSIITSSPNGGEDWVRGTTKTIRWSYSGSPGTYVKIELLKGGVLNRVITYSTPIGSSGSGYYNWYLPTTQMLGTDYKIRITSASNSAYTDISSNNFKISAASVTVSSPNGGESWLRGTAHAVNWISAGNPGTYVKIELLKGGVLNRAIISSTPNDGSFSWTVPSTQTLGSDYKIRITSTSNSAYNDWSNNYFRIY